MPLDVLSGLGRQAVFGNYTHPKGEEEQEEKGRMGCGAEGRAVWKPKEAPFLRASVL